MSDSIEEYQHEHKMYEDVDYAYNHLLENLSDGTKQELRKLQDDCNRYFLEFDELLEIILKEEETNE